MQPASFEKAKLFDWISVLGLLDKNPDMIDTQISGRWSCLNQAIFAQEPDAVKMSTFFGVVSHFDVGLRDDGAREVSGACRVW